MNQSDRIEFSRSQVICFSLLIAQGIYSLATLWTTPSLIGSHPVLLELLRGSTSSLVAGGAFAKVGRASLVLALIAPIPTLMMSNPVLWWAGRLWGPDVVELIVGERPGARRRAQWAIRWIERGRGWAVFLAPVLPIPSAIVYAAAGWTRMRFAWFLILDLLGTLLWIGLIVGLGYAIGHPAVHVAHEITHYGLIFTIAVVVLSVGLAVWRQPRRPPSAGEPDEDSAAGPEA